jgi:hypothetical protein
VALIGFFIFFASSGAIQPVISWAKTKVTKTVKLNTSVHPKNRGLIVVSFLQQIPL